MATAAQQSASRQNGAQSSGPTTDEGKTRSAKNSVKHGLCAREFVLTCHEDQAGFAKLLADLTFVHQAKHEAEQEACRTLAVATWRRRTCDNLEAQLLAAIENGNACAQTGGDGLPSLSTICRYRARISRDIREAKDELKALRAARVKAIQDEMTKAKELTDQTLLKGLVTHMGFDAFNHFRHKVAPIEQTNPTPPQTQVNTEKTDRQLTKEQAKKKAQKQARKIERNNRK